MNASWTIRSLAPHNFDFFGFQQAMPRIEAKLPQLGIAIGDPKILVAEDVIYVPATRRHQTSAPSPSAVPAYSGYVGGFTLPDGEPLEWSYLRRGGKSVVGGLSRDSGQSAQQSWNEYHGEVIYLGWFFHHFGHFLVESLSRVWCLSELDASLPIVFHALESEVPHGMIHHVLERFGVPAERVLLPRQPTRFQRVYVPESLHELHYRVHERAPIPYRNVAERVIATDGPGASDQPVYISRRLLPNDKRALVGEWELEEALQDNGFLIARPESMTFEDQVRLFNRHQNIVAVEQSALNSVLFSLRSLHVHCISTWGIPLGDFFLLPKVSGAQASYVNATSDYNAHQPTSRQSIQILNLSTLLEYLQDRGFIRKPVRSRLARQVPDLGAQYVETVLYLQLQAARKWAQPLTESQERECKEVARHSWPLCFALAYNYCTNDPKNCKKFAGRFARLVDSEHDIARLARFHADIERMLPCVLRGCASEGAAVRSAVSRKFALDL